MGRARFFTVEEAARVLRIGRTAAYAAAKRYRQTDGAEGLPVVVICGSLRVPGGWLEEMAGGPIDLDDLTPPATPPDERGAKPPEPSKTSTRVSSPVTPSTSDASQCSLPFSG